MNYRETRNVLVDKLIIAYEVDTKDVGDCVELYYDAQKLRIIHANKERTEGAGELKSWFAYWLNIGESVISSKLQAWIVSEKAPREAQWAYSQIGIGPVIASGLAAHIDVSRAPAVSSLWKFAGYAPGFDKKIKGQKLPYNSRLKTLCWKMGESFVKVSGNKDAVYGALYVQFKAEELSRNDSGQYAGAAKRELATKRISDPETKKTLESGRLIKGHLHERAKRRAIKIFLSHYWTIAREARGLEVRQPYVQQILGHDGIIKP
jgi:hypothetical protein